MHYGIFIDDHAEPYLTCGDLDTALGYVRENEATGHQATAMILDPVCVCGQAIPGWYEVDENGDMIDRPCHSACRSDVAAMEHADTWF